MDKVILPTSFSIAPRLGQSVSIPQACEVVGVSRRTIYNWIQGGQLQTYRTPAGAVRVVLTSLREEAVLRGHAMGDWPPLPVPGGEQAVK